ncbi:MAG: pirin-like protein, partial [Herbinix sp.]|nr:pirin-like protein [Herbinix sp.]
NDGCCQWMTAGKAIIHQEMPQPSKRMLGLQLWLNLPKKDKMVEPKYRDIRSEMIPVIEEQGSIVRILSGYYKEQAGAMQGDYVKATVLDVTILPGTTWSIATDPEETVFTYILEGAGSFGGNEKEALEARRAVLFSKGEELEIAAQSESVRIVLFMGKPLQEPIAWGGPVVMNTAQELEQAFREIREGTFVKA